MGKEEKKKFKTLSIQIPEAEEKEGQVLDIGTLATIAPAVSAIYRSPKVLEAAGKINAEIEAEIEKIEDGLAELKVPVVVSDCGGDLATVIVIVMIVGPAPGPT